MLFYWYDAAVPERCSTTSYKIKLPPVFKGCLDDEKDGGTAKKYRCDYAPYVLDKLISGKFATSGSPAVSVRQEVEVDERRSEASSPT